MTVSTSAPLDRSSARVRSMPLPTSRADLLTRLARSEEYDLAIIGGGATGLGVAVDAASRGLRVVLVESHDFAKGTSSRATKLVHGGVVRIVADFKEDHLELLVQNTGQLNLNVNGDGFGIKSTQDRLNLMYQGKATFAIRNMGTNMVESKVTMPVII